MDGDGSESEEELEMTEDKDNVELDGSLNSGLCYMVQSH